MLVKLVKRLKLELVLVLFSLFTCSPDPWVLNNSPEHEKHTV